MLCAVSVTGCCVLRVSLDVVCCECHWVLCAVSVIGECVL